MNVKAARYRSGGRTMTDAAENHVFREQGAPVRADLLADLLHGVRLREPDATDAAKVLGLVSACAPLDVNSLYCYLILCPPFRESCMLAERDGEVLGFVSGYREPSRPDVLFCWQVAVAAKLRKSGLARAMLKSILSSPASRGVRTVEATVTGSNHASMRLFRRPAGDPGAPGHVAAPFSGRALAAVEHER